MKSKTAHGPRLEAKDGQFLLGGAPFRILSGAMHYFRIVPEYWEDRLIKLKAMGLNTVETYVAWNLHETKPGEFHFDGIRDVEAFLRLAGRLGLHAIVRPGPYICAEWDFGGLPHWLLADPGMRVRCLHVPFLEAVDRWFDELMKRLAPLQSTRGGPVIAFQVENEYGSYGNDKKYLQYVEMGLRQRGADVLLFTSDGWSDGSLQGGTLPHVLKTVNFGTKAPEAIAKLREYQPAGPDFCAEFWCGWFDHWGKKHHTRNAADAAAELDKILQAGASVNFYMFHGGTNFGFMNGANHDGVFSPTVTSYDYDAPLSEHGDPTDKYFAFREVLARHGFQPTATSPRTAERRAYGGFRALECAPLFSSLKALGAPVRRTMPEPMERLGQGYGYILYRTEVTGPRSGEELIIQDAHDRALVFIDGKPAGTLERDRMPASLPVSIPGPKATLEILVENMCRVNFGPALLDRKGITEGVRLGNQFLYHWNIQTLPMDNLSRLEFGPVRTGAGPAFFRVLFHVGEPADTFLALPGWTRGVCWINGFNVGRYWNAGPQRTLYVPAPLLRDGENELIVFELHESQTLAVDFLGQPELS